MPTSPSVDEKLDVIIRHLEALDRRDKLRTTGALIRAVIGLIPLVIFIYSFWYAINNAQELMTQISRAAATAAAEATQNSGKGMLDDLLKKYEMPSPPKR